MGLISNAALQNGFNPTDTFDPIKELRRARAANAGQKLVDNHAKEEAVLGAALNAHGGDSANLDEDNVDVSLSIIILHSSPGCIQMCPGAQSSWLLVPQMYLCSS